MSVLKHVPARTNVLTRKSEKESKIRDALAEAYLSGRQEIVLEGTTLQDIQTVVNRLSDPCSANVVLRRTFSLAVHFASGRNYSLETTTSRDDVIHFNPVPLRKEKEGTVRPLSFTLTGKFCPLFDFTSST